MKPLSLKSLQKKYEQANINENECQLLHKYFLCFSNLYGVIQIEELWNIFKGYKEAITKQKFYDFVDIVQREANEYSIFDLSEVYTGETSKDTKDKLLIKDVLVGKRYGKFWYVKIVLEYMNYNIGPYIPSKNELFKFDHDLFYESNEGQSLANFVANLKTSGIEKDKFKINHIETMLDPNGHPVKGKCLKDFIYLCNFEKFDIKYYSRYSEELTKEYSIDTATKILNYIEMNIMTRDVKEMTMFMQFALDKICYEYGVDMDDEQAKEFIDLYMKIFNACHRWVNYGWSGNDLIKSHPIKGPINLQFGPNIQKMIDDGIYDLEEIKTKLKEKGISIVEDDEKINEDNQKYLN